MKICMTSNENRFKEASKAGKAMLKNNSFPNEKIEGDPSDAVIPQPKGKEELAIGLLSLKDELSKLQLLMPNATFYGKTKHPGLDYFNATEWLQFTDMHFRHHLRQKKRIDEFLASVN